MTSLPPPYPKFWAAERADLIAGSGNLLARCHGRLCAGAGAVVFPKDVAQVAAVVRILPRTPGADCSARRRHESQRRRCTGAGAVVLSLQKLDRILETNAQNLTMLVEPGVITAQIDEIAATQGLFYPPDPGSIKTCTIGGNVASNAVACADSNTASHVIMFGARSGVADGEVAWLGSQCRKDAAVIRCAICLSAPKARWAL